MLIKFCCNNEDCNNTIDKYFTKSKDIPAFLDCGSCGIGKLERTLGAPASKSVQYVDNGLQARKTEVSSELVQRETERLKIKESEND